MFADRIIPDTPVTPRKAAQTDKDPEAERRSVMTNDKKQDTRDDNMSIIGAIGSRLSTINKKTVGGTSRLIAKTHSALNSFAGQPFQ